MRNCQNSRNVFNLIETNLSHGENLLSLASGYTASSGDPEFYHSRLVINALRDILGMGGELGEYDGERGASLEFVFQELVEGRKTATFVLFGYDNSEGAGFISMGDVKEGKLFFYSKTLVNAWDETYDIETKSLGANESGILFDTETANWWHPEHPFTTGKWREALDEDRFGPIFGEPSKLSFLPTDFNEDISYLWICPPEVLNPIGLFNWFW